MMGTERVRVLVVEDDDFHRETLAEHLSERGHQVESASNGEAALSRFSDADPDIVITDIKMPGIDGFGLLQRVKEHAPGVDVIMLTGQAAVQPAIDSMKRGAFDFLLKPIDLDDVDSVLNRCVAERCARAEGLEIGGEDLPMPTSERLVGRHPRMLEIYKTIGAVSSGTAPVLICGETGTGKELVARSIHANSPNGEEPFVAVNCAALPDGLLESELFGHVRGAFTGAVEDRKGRFELAKTGTILLDEIGDTSQGLQAKLLRVLQEREFFPVGGEGPRNTNARVLAATNRSLVRLVEEGKFREDLLFRLRVVEVRIPPLRDRRSDIPLLVSHILKKVAEDLGGPLYGLSRDAMGLLLSHDWPGNVRELENTLTRAAVLCRGALITPEDITFTDGSDAPPPPPGAETLASMERQHVQRILVNAEGNKSEAARVLGISRPRLDRMIERHDLAVM